MSKLYLGSIDYDKLMDILKSGKASTFKSQKTGKRYVNISVWQNNEPNQYGNSLSIQVGTKEEYRGEKLNHYIANLKLHSPEEVKAEEFRDDGDDDLPF